MHYETSSLGISSFLWAFFHFTLTLLLAGLRFLFGRESLGHDVSDLMPRLEALQRFWSPWASAAWEASMAGSLNLAMALAFIWSCLIGVVLGLFRSCLSP